MYSCLLSWIFITSSNVFFGKFLIKEKANNCYIYYEFWDDLFLCPDILAIREIGVKLNQSWIKMVINQEITAYNFKTSFMSHK